MDSKEEDKDQELYIEMETEDGIEFSVCIESSSLDKLLKSTAYSSDIDKALTMLKNAIKK